MSLPDRNVPWPEMVTYFKNNKKDGENLGVVLKRASYYRKTGKVLENVKMSGISAGSGREYERGEIAEELLILARERPAMIHDVIVVAELEV